MRCEGVLLYLTLVRLGLRLGLGLRDSKLECSEEFSRERQLYPLCVPRRCGRVVRDISQVQASSHNIKHNQSGLQV